MASVTKPVALDETLQSTNTALSAQTGKLNDIIAKLQLIATALGNPELIGDTDISGIADGTITGAIAEIDGDVTDLQEDMLTAQRDIDNMQDALSDDVVTATGNPISITTLSAQYAQSTKINIEPIQSGSGDPSPSNIRPITGRSYLIFNVHGKNELKQSAFETAGGTGITYTVDSNGVITLNGSASSAFFVGFRFFLKAGRYVLNGCPSAGGINSYRQDIRANAVNGMVVSNIADVGSGYSFTLAEDLNAYFTIRIAGNYSCSNLKFRPMIYSQEAESTYEPYKSPTDLTFSFGQAVFCGNLDVEIGKLTVTMENIASYAGETLPGVWISDRDVYAAGTTPTTGAQVVYEIASPYTIQLTGAQVELLKGLNNVVSDANEITLTYRSGEVATLADVVELDKKIDASSASSHVYSTNEHVVGTWIDGKPLYEKTFSYSGSNIVITPHSWTTVPFTDVIPNISYFFHTMETTDCSDTRIRFKYDAGYLKAAALEDLNVSQLVVTIRYTKTTD